jgi:hypothetical protein
MQCSKDETEIITMDIGGVSKYPIWDRRYKGYLMTVYQMKRPFSKISRQNEGMNYRNDKVGRDVPNKKKKFNDYKSCR